MEELLTALTTAVQSAVSIFVEGFGGLTQIFYNGTEITFIGGILIVGLAVMFLMMFLRWIVSFVKKIKKSLLNPLFLGGINLTFQH